LLLGVGTVGDAAFAVDDALPGDVGGGVFTFSGEGTEGVADGAGNTGSTEHLGDAAVGGDFTGGDALDEGVYVLIKVRREFYVHVCLADCHSNDMTFIISGVQGKCYDVGRLYIGFCGQNPAALRRAQTLN
jgi:hypothetical protein